MPISVFDFIQAPPSELQDFERVYNTPEREALRKHVAHRNNLANQLGIDVTVASGAELDLVEQLTYD